MGHLTAPLLQPRVVADLIGLSPGSLRRWDAALLSGADRRPRRYSWAEVEILQRAVHQASGRGGTPAAFQGMRAAPAGARRPRSIGQRRRAKRSVVTVGLPRSPGRRERRTTH
ncbi:MAG: hypothetical protein ACYDAB_14140 [bacterium]